MRIAAGSLAVDFYISKNYGAGFWCCSTLPHFLVRKKEMPHVPGA
jgi:hypothetical protein